MTPTFSTQISAWFENTSNLQYLVLVLLAALIAAVWLQRHADGQLRLSRQRYDALQQDNQRLATEVERTITREAGLEARIADLAEQSRRHELELTRVTSMNEAGRTRLQELGEERDGLSDVLHGLRQQNADLQRQLAEARLAAEKDRESAAREITALRELREEMTREFKLMSDEVARTQGAELQKRHSDQLTALLTPFRDQVHRFQTELQTRNKQTDEERARLREQIETLHKRSEDISREALALTRALKGDRQRQGAWGEMILERLLEESGLENGLHYVTQDSRRDEDGKRWRPDVIVKLPKKKVLVIDSKVSLSAYEEAVNSEDLALREAALKRHVAAVRAHVTSLSDKGYHALDDGSVDYVLMFVPIEGAFSEALRVDPTLASFAMERRVGLTTPTTLMLTLRTVDHIWTVERRESNAMQIANRAGMLYDKLHGFVSAIEEVGTALDRAQRSHNTAMDRLTRGPGNVIRQAEMLRELGARAQKRLELDHDGTTADMLATEGE